MMKQLAHLILCLAFLTACGNETTSSTYAENDDWVRECHFEYSCRIEAAPDQTENTYRFELRQIDYDGTRGTKSAELKTGKYHKIGAYSQSSEAWLGFRLYIPEDYMPENNIFMFAQTHGIPDMDLGEKWRLPPTELTIVNGNFLYTYFGDNRKLTPKSAFREDYTHPGEIINLGPATPNHWHNFVIHEVFNTDGNGKVEIWFGGEHIVRENLVLGFDDDKGPYWKFGVYALGDEIEDERMVVYFNQVKAIVGEGSYDGVAPRASNEAAE